VLKIRFVFILQRKIEARFLQIEAQFFQNRNSQNWTQNRGSISPNRGLILTDSETSILSQFSTIVLLFW